jgi:hypothetical protein
MKAKSNFDVLVIGGGPAGIMAAIISADFGLNVAILEKNKSLARKLLLTGGGRCNITNATFDNKKLAKQYGKEGFFLLPAFECFDVKKTIDFFEQNGLKTKIEGQKVYCQTDKAGDVVNLLEKILKDKKIPVFYNSNVSSIEKNGKEISKVILSDGKEISAQSYILATGGKTYTATGSTGQGYKFAEFLGHKIKTPKPGLVPIKIKEDWVKKLQGISINSAQFNLLCDNKKRLAINGEVIFTHFGLSGPAILNASSQIEDLSKKGKITIFMDLFPNKDIKELEGDIIELFSKNANKNIKNCLSELLPEKLISVILDLSKIDSSKKINAITKEERKNIVLQFKKSQMNFDGTLGFENAMITSGGVLLKEIEAKTMQSKIIKNLFFAGEIINLHGPSGGYNLQMCWSTGYLAGQSVAKN